MQYVPDPKQAALIISSSHLHKDPRVLRQISWLSDSYRVVTVGYSSSGVDRVDHVPFDPPQKSALSKKLRRALTFFSRNYEGFYWDHSRTALIRRLKAERYSLIIANDYDALPIAVRLKGPDTTVLFDAHEYSPLEFTESVRWRILQQPLIKYICREYIPYATVATTVCHGIAQTYECEYGRKFEVITNASEYVDLLPSNTGLDKIRLIYHGGASKSRQTHKQIEMMKFLDDRVELNLMIVGEQGYIDKLKRMAAPLNNVRFLPPVPTTEIAAFTNQFDVGIYSLPPTNFNNRFALPNKFFEFIQARLAMVVGPSPEMARIVHAYDLGLVAEDFSPESMASAIRGLTAERIDHFKAQADKHAYELSAEKSRELFLEIIGSPADRTRPV